MWCHPSSFLKHFFFVLIFFLAFGVRRGFPNAGFDEMFLQEFKTKEEVKAFFVRWAAEKKDKDGFRDLDDCIEQLSRQDGEDLLVHVTEEHRTKKEFCNNWTNCPTHFLCGRLDNDLRKWLGAGKGDCCVSLDVMM